jgi:hypothetical protein
VWDTYQGAKNEDDLATKLQGMELPKEVKAKLWDMKAGVNTAAPTPKVPPKPGAFVDEQGNPAYIGYTGELEPPEQSAAVAAGGLATAALPFAPQLSTLAGRVILSRPVATAYGAYKGYEHGGIPGAIEGGLIGFAGGSVYGRLSKLALKLVAPAAEAAEAAPAVAAATKAAPAAPYEQAIAAAKAAVGNAPAATAKWADAAIERAAAPTNMARIFAFAKNAAAKNPKVGEKVWMELDPGGVPFRVLTPDQAAAAARAGRATTWVKNLWARP